MKKQFWLPVLSPLPFVLIYYLNARNEFEALVYYLIFAVLIRVALFMHKRKSNDGSKYSDRTYDDYMI